MFAESPTLYWSGNSNQIYRSLVELHEQGLVTTETYQQANKPPRKVYTITPQGRDALKQWIQSTPEIPQLRSSFLVQLAWADLLAPAELDRLLAVYEDELRVQQLMLREQVDSLPAPDRTPREAYLWDMITEN